MPSKEFLQMMKCPTVGHNGGNPKAEIWFCGIENGWSGDESGKGHMKHNMELLKDPNHKTTYDPVPKGYFIALRKILKTLGLFDSDSNDPNDWFYKKAKFYSVNLYPFAFPARYPTAKADKEILELTGIKTKREYMQECDRLRCANPKWHELHKNAKVIVCFGKECWDDFIWQFSKSDREYELLKEDDKSITERTTSIELSLDNGNILILCPHPSSIKPRLDIDKLCGHIRRYLTK